MSDFKIDKNSTALEIEWDVDGAKNTRTAGIYVLVRDDHALTDRLMVSLGKRVVAETDEIAATGCIRLSLGEAERMQRALNRMLGEARKFMARKTRRK